MKIKKNKLYEVDLYKPIQHYFTKQGYVVNGEVNDCDVTAIRDNELIIIELKLSLTLTFLYKQQKDSG